MQRHRCFQEESNIHELFSENCDILLSFHCFVLIWLSFCCRAQNELLQLLSSSSLTLRPRGLSSPVWHYCRILVSFNTLNPELNPICCLLALLVAHHFLHVSRIRVKSLTFRLLMSYIYGAPILDVSRSHTTTHHSR